MSNSDKRISAAVAFGIIIHLVILTLGFIIPSFFISTPLLNLIVGLSILAYWLQKQIRITQHYFELREFVVLSSEVIVIASAVCSLLMRQIQWLSVAQVVILSVHLIALLVFFVFMITFKMKKLF